MQSSVRAAYVRPAATLAAIAVLLLSLAVLIQPVAAQGPPGENGTVKIDGIPFDQGPGDSGPGDPDNEPHINACFAIDWYGFDQGEFFGTVTFQVWPPVGPKQEIDGVATQVLHPPANGHAAFGNHDQHVYIGEDSNAGAGSTAGRDASIVYDLSAALAAYEPHANQGWHVKITIVNDGVQGGRAVKHKVVWVDGPCFTPTQTTPFRTGGTGGFTFSPPPPPRPPDTSTDAMAAWALVVLSGTALLGSATVFAMERIRAGRRT